jgi:acetyl-CoA carboxylase biotin carboxyl carrier protein
MTATSLATVEGPLWLLSNTDRWSAQLGRKSSSRRLPGSSGEPGRAQGAPDRADGPWEIEVAQVEAHITGTVWKIECAVGDAIEEGDTVAILESMKMEMPVEAEDAGTVSEIRCEEGQAVNEGDVLVVLD